MNQVLVTGFGPFGGEPINPALEAVKKLDKRVLAAHELVTRELPVVRQDSIDAIIKYIRELDPVLVVAIGQAGGRLEITPERVAINLDDYRIADNAGHKPVDESVVARAPVAYWSTLPIKAMVKEMKDKGIPAGVSNSAGTFVCNHLFYGLMHYLATEGNKRRGGFIHIPYLPEQAARLGNQPSVGLDTIVRGLEIAIETAITHSGDVKISGGAIS
jgi:pyroglutamyl-peptidase